MLIVVSFSSNQGLMNVAAGIGYASGPPLGGVLYAVKFITRLCPTALHYVFGQWVKVANPQFYTFILSVGQFPYCYSTTCKSANLQIC